MKQRLAIALGAGLVCLLCLGEGTAMAKDASPLQGFARSQQTQRSVNLNTNTYTEVIGDAAGMNEYRWYNQDFGWTHTFPIKGRQIISAKLEICAWDVDSEPIIGFGDPGWWEHNLVYPWAGPPPIGARLLGELRGESDVDSITEFSIDPVLLADGALPVWLDIDATHATETWGTTVKWSRLTVQYKGAGVDSQRFLWLPLDSATGLLQGWKYDSGGKHEGIDYDTPVGTPILAAADGVAMSSTQALGSTYSYGNFVLIKHPNGYYTLYAHLSSISADIKAYPESKRNNKEYAQWTPVTAGQVIGYSGNTGTVYPHLHFEVSSKGYAMGRVDPYDLYSTSYYYPPNAGYKGMGPKQLWATTPPTPLSW
ncbi:MAG: M23 family metallopeptidase [Actinomycetota bacterium]|nr:M23 family metallopeptidase [Actinomycetota bacterium]